MRPKADPKREIKVYRVKDRFRAETIIKGQPAFLERVYVKSTKGGIIPKVEYVELFGKEIKKGDDLYEKLTPP